MTARERAETSPTPLVRKSIEVRVSTERAFQAFTEQPGSWWPLATHHIGAAPAETAVIEPRVGGRWYELGVDGSECDWGHVLVWDPPHRLVLSWEISADWKPDATTLPSEVEVRFIALEHRLLDRFGARAEELRGMFDSEGGWGTMLQLFAAAVSGASR